MAAAAFFFTRQITLAVVEERKSVCRGGLHDGSDVYMGLQKESFLDS